MKKILSIFVGAIMIAALCISASAAAPTEGLIYYYSFDTAGSTAIDSVNGINLAIAGENRFVEGISGTGLSFDGSSDQVLQLGQPITAINSQNAVTVSLWAKFDASQETDHTLIGWGSGADPDNYYRLFVQGGSHNIGSQTNTGYPYGWNNNADVVGEENVKLILDDNWHHIAMVHDGAEGTITFYIDGIAYPGFGAPDGSADAQDYKIGPMTYWLTIGSMHDKVSANFKGVMDELRIYDGALTADQISALYDINNEGGGEGGSPDTFDMLTTVGIAALISTAGVVLSKKRR